MEVYIFVHSRTLMKMTLICLHNTLVTRPHYIHNGEFGAKCVIIQWEILKHRNGLLHRTNLPIRQAGVAELFLALCSPNLHQCLWTHLQVTCNENAQLPCWPLNSQQVSRLRWIWGSHRQEKSMSGNASISWPPFNIRQKSNSRPDHNTNNKKSVPLFSMYLCLFLQKTEKQFENWAKA